MQSYLNYVQYCTYIFTSAILYRTVQLKSIISSNIEYVFSLITFHRAYVNYYNTQFMHSAVQCKHVSSSNNLLYNNIVQQNICCTILLYNSKFVVQQCCTTLLYNIVVPLCCKCDMAFIHWTVYL